MTRARIAPLLLILALLLAGCQANARSQLAAANKTKNALNESLYAGLESDYITLTPEQAKRVKAASVAASAALDEAARHVNPDGTAGDRFASAFDIAAAAIDALRAELRSANIPHD